MGRHAKGFTLVELLIALVVLSILASIAVPSYQRTIAQQKLRTAASDLRIALAQTRSEAVKVGSTATISKVGDAWTGGWEITADGDVVGNFTPPEGTTVSGSSSSVRFNTWGRVGQCEQFQLQTRIASGDCTLCLYLANDGQVSTEVGECTSACSATAGSPRAWSEVCP